MRLVDALRLGWRRRLPVVLQTETAECGLACLAMLASYHGHEIDLPTLRRTASVSPHGTTLATLIGIAGRLGLETRAVRVELADLRHLRLPCVLHWNLTHFVVLRSVGRRGITIHDPSHGRRFVATSEVHTAFTGVALEVWPGSRFERRAAAPAVGLRDLAGRVTGLGPWLAQLLLLAATLEAFAMASPLLVQWIVDHALLTGDTDLVALLALGFGLLVLAEHATAALRSLAIMRFGSTLNLQWHANVFGHLLALPLPYFERRHLGDIVSRFRSIDSIQRTVTTAFIEALVDGVMTLVLVAVLFVYSATLAGICLGAVALYALGRAAAHGPLRSAALEQIAGSARQESHFLETVRGARAIKLFRRHAERRAAWLALLVEQLNAGLRSQRLQILLRTANGVVFGLEHVLVIYLGAQLVLDGALSTGMLLAFVAYQRQFALRVSALIDKLAELRLLRLHGERLADIVLTEREPSPGAAHEEYAAPLAPTVSVRGLRFRYAEHEPLVLDGIDLDVAAGESVAIVGPSGCGKSTLVHVLLGVLTPTAGEVRIGGLPLEHIDRERLRRAVAGVTQSDCLFAGSIADNIAFFDARPDRRHIEDCARLAAIDDDIRKLPMGYDTLVGYMGSALSGGQQQRLLLARALYARPSILVLDEATSHLDVDREARVSEAVRRLAITRIVVAHRRETIAAADRIVTLDRGRIVPASSAADAQPGAPPTRLPHFALAPPRADDERLIGSLGC